MRGLFLGLVALMVSLSLFSVPNLAGPVSDGFRLVSENDQEVVVEFVLPEYKIDELKVDKEIYNVITSTSQAYTTQVGMPYLPMFATGIAVANQGKVTCEVIKSEYSEIKLNKIFPSQKEGFVYQNITLEDNNFDGFFPETEFSSGDNFILRDFRVKPVQIKPFRYDESKETLRIYHKISFKISTDVSQSGFNELLTSGEISPAFHKVYQASILNYHRDEDLAYSPNILFIYRENGDPIFNYKLEQYTKIKRQKGYNVLSLSTGEIGSTSTSGIKNYIQNLYNGNDFKPDYLVLIGDVSGSFAIPTFNATYAMNAEGDYPYTHLQGDDLVGDIFIGRMSINNSTDLSRYVGKMRSYERFLNPIEQEYLDNMLLVADTDPSGESTINHCKFVKQISSIVNPDYTYTELYSNNPNSSSMNQAINNGIDFFVYRGYIGMSGWDPGSAQTNSHKLNHGVIITCATGNFNGTATTEAYVNLGSETDPKGGITAIGMATAHTHTSFNNSLSGGIFHGIYNLGQDTMGQALLTGKVTTHIVYSESDMTDVKQFTHWCNLIGDPSVDVYTGQPNHFTYEVSDFNPSTEELVVIAKNQENIPVNSARVTLTNQDGEISSAFSNNEGVVTFQLDPGMIEYTLTIDKDNFFPLQEQLIDNSDSYIEITSFTIDDDNEGQSNGNNNQNMEAGETVEVNFMINNLSNINYENVQAILSVNNYQIDVMEELSEISSLPGQSSSLFDSNFVLHINNNVANDTEIALVLDLTYGENETHRLYQTAQIHNGDLILTDTNLTMLGNSLEANQTATISVTIQNQADVSIENASANLVVDNAHFNVLTDDILIPLLAANQSHTLDFEISPDIDMFPGMTSECVLRVNNEVNFFQVIKFDIKFGQLGNGSPLGPDSFGYVIYDSNDIDYPECPSYDWIEIAPNNGGSGIALDIYDPDANGEGDGVGSNSTDTLDLPFQFIYYGESYNQITVCSNGFISFGENSNGEFRNWRLPGALGPNGMIAPFWDDMHMNSNSGIFSYYDSEEDYFVIQWEQMINGAANHPDEETFQIILYNPQSYPSSLNQGTAKIQYKVFNNVDNGNPGNYTPWHGNYATIGLESPCGNDGLEYTYNQNYPAGAHQLEDGMALFITTKPIILVEPQIDIAEILVHDQNNNGIYEINEEIKIGLALINKAITPLMNTSATISSSDQRISILNSNSLFDDLVANEEIFAREYFKVKLNEEINNNDTFTLHLEIQGDGGYHFYKDFNININKANLISRNFIINDYSETGNNNSIPEQGENLYLAWEIENTTNVDGYFDNVSISTSNPNLTLITSNMNNIKVKANSIQQLVFEASVLTTAPDFESIELSLAAEKDGQIILENSYTLALNTSETLIDFESEDIPLTYNLPWETGSSNYTSAYSGSNLLGTNLDYEYSNNVNSVAWTDYFEVMPTTNLTFWHKYSIESNYDGGQIIASIEGSSTNTVLIPFTGYTNENLPALGGPGFSGNQNNWTEVNMIIPNSLQGQTVRFGFRFASDSMVNDEGWFIDDITIGGSVQESFVFTGDVTLVGGDSEITATEISLAGYSLNPLYQGTYRALLPLGSHEALFSLPGYRSELIPLADITTNQMITEDVSLNYLNKPESLTHTLQDSILTLNWDYDEDSDDQLSYFHIEKKFNTGKWEVLNQTTSTTHTLELSNIGLYSFRIRANYQDDYSNYSNIVFLDYLSGTDNETNEVAFVTTLHGNYPNPFNPETNIAYTLAKATNVKLKIYNLRGQLVRNLLDEHQSSGKHKTLWNGKNNYNKAVASGIYLIRIETDSYNKTHKAILMK